MNRKVLIASVGSLVAVSIVVPAYAHHSHAMFDSDKVQTVTGVVSNVRFANPHVYVELKDVDDGKGGKTGFNIEMSTVSNMMSRGILATTLKPGDKVVIDVNPLRSGDPGGNYTGIRSINNVQNTDGNGSGNNWKPKA